MRERIGFRLLGVLAGGCGLYVFLFCIVYFGMAREGFFLSAIDIPKIEARWGMEEEDVKLALRKMLSYVKSWDEEMSPQFEVRADLGMTEFYTDREISHMRDVQRVMKGFSIAAVIATVVGLISIGVLVVKKQLGEMAYGYIYVLAFLLLVLVIVGVVSLIDLQWLINAFHKLLFENNTWVLNPAKHKVVWFFGKAVYRKAIVYFIVTAAVIIAMLIGAICYIKRHYVNFFKKR